MIPKPEPRRRAKARAKRAEDEVKRRNRALVEARDGYCRLLHRRQFGPCEGRSEWNHLKKRSLTVNQDPEIRHSTRTSVMNCERHHDMVDDHVIKFEYLTTEGADGPMRFRQGDVVFEEAR